MICLAKTRWWFPRRSFRLYGLVGDPHAEGAAAEESPGRAVSELQPRYLSAAEAIGPLSKTVQEHVGRESKPGGAGPSACGVVVDSEITSAAGLQLQARSIWGRAVSMWRRHGERRHQH